MLMKYNNALRLLIRFFPHKKARERMLVRLRRDEFTTEMVEGKCIYYNIINSRWSRY